MEGCKPVNNMNNSFQCLIVLKLLLTAIKWLEPLFRGPDIIELCDRYKLNKGFGQHFLFRQNPPNSASCAQQRANMFTIRCAFSFCWIKTSQSEKTIELYLAKISLRENTSIYQILKGIPFSFTVSYNILVELT